MNQRTPQRFLATGIALFVALFSHEATAEGLYRVEILVFQHRYSDAEPVGVDSVRGFHDLLELDTDNGPDTPRLVEKGGGTFDSIRRRLQRLDAYQPLALLIYEQSRIDYHPPVRLHNGEVIAEELHYPSEQVVFNLDAINIFEPYVSELYRLDGSIQLRRSRFLHVDLDLEYRVDDPAWAEAFPPLNFYDSGEALPDDPFRRPETELPGSGLGPGAPVEDRSDTPATPSSPFGSDNDSTAGPNEGVTLEQETPEPFRIHRLKQSRQVRTDTIQYFDSAFLGALVRITATESAPSEEPTE